MSTWVRIPPLAPKGKKMIVVERHVDEWNIRGWYFAKATKLKKTASGITRELALRNLREVIRKNIK